MACDRPVAAGETHPAILAPVPGFVMYAMSAALQGHGLHWCAADFREFALDVPAMVQAIETRQPAIVYLAYPNNPTANLWDRADMAQVIAAAARVRQPRGRGRGLPALFQSQLDRRNPQRVRRTTAMCS